MAYCASRFETIRRRTVEVNIGAVGVGGDHPIRIQSMTTSDTQDIAATVRQSIALAEVGCEIVRITAPNVAAARCLKEIRAQFSAAGFGHIPLVADIHFLPNAAMEAVEHVEKVRVNPGNYADKKKFAVRDYSDADYDLELQRLHEAFSPLVLRAKELGRSLRIGTNHGSLSDRIMNRYGDTPLGMVESALEFLRIAESHRFHQLILSMKASNPKVMIQAYRLLVERMQQENMHYPLHLGVTEAGDGEDGRIKSAIGIGSLLLDGLGDTIRVSLTEDSVYEIPVARAIAQKTMSLWPTPGDARPASALPADAIDPFQFTRRETTTVHLTNAIAVGPELPPRVLTRVDAAQAAALLTPATERQLKDTPVEGLILAINSASDLDTLPATGATCLVLELASALSLADLRAHAAHLRPGTLLVREFSASEADAFTAWATFAREHRLVLAAAIDHLEVAALAGPLRSLADAPLVFTLTASPALSPQLSALRSRIPASDSQLSALDSQLSALSSQLAAPSRVHPVGRYRLLAGALRSAGSRAPIWIRNTAGSAVSPDNSFLSRLLEASFLTGSLLCDGLGDLVSIETEPDPLRATKLAYNVLQGAGVRSSKTEFVACPSCGRTLFDLQTTTQRIRAQTGHLKGVKLAIMGCIVNGPGEMADADFGYVGGAPGKINLYVGKQCVHYNIPQEEADARLIALIKEHGKWVDPEPSAA